MPKKGRPAAVETKKYVSLGVTAITAKKAKLICLYDGGKNLKDLVAEALDFYLENKMHIPVDVVNESLETNVPFPYKNNVYVGRSVQLDNA